MRMRRIRIGAAAAALALTGSAAAAQDKGDFCSELRRVMDSARGIPAFASLERARPDLGFNGGPCFRFASNGVPGYRCSRNLAPAGFSHQSLAAQTRACLPEAVEVQPASRRARRFQYRDFDIEIGESGADHGHVGRRVSFSVMLRR